MKRQAIAMGMALGLSFVNAAYAEVDSNGIDYDDKFNSAANCGAKTPAASTVGKGGGLFNTSGTASNDLTCALEHDRWDEHDRYYALYGVHYGSAPMPCYLQVYDGAATTVYNQNAGGPEFVLFFSHFNYGIHSTLGCTAPKKAGGQSSGIRRYGFTEY